MGWIWEFFLLASNFDAIPYFHKSCKKCCKELYSILYQTILNILPHLVWHLFFPPSLYILFMHKYFNIYFLRTISYITKVFLSNSGNVTLAQYYYLIHSSSPSFTNCSNNILYSLLSCPGYNPGSRVVLIVVFP